MISHAHSNDAARPLLTHAEAHQMHPGAWQRCALAPPRLYARPDVALRWSQLHPHGEPVPESDLLDGWTAFHNGDFAQAALLAQAMGDAGLALLNESTAVYASYVEPREATRLGLLRQVAARAQQQLDTQPNDVAALFWLAFALGRHAQAVSVARALAQGLGSQIKSTLERLIALQPRHADAHFALGAFHAEVIDKVGPLVGHMTYDVRASTAQALFVRGLALNPHSAGGHIEYARALVALYGEDRLDEATQLYERAAAIEPLDCRDRLVQELARQWLSD